MKGNQGGKKNWGVDRNSIFLIGSVGLRGRVPKGDQEGTGGGVDDSGGRIRVQFLFATKRVVLWQVKGREGERVVLHGRDIVNSCGGRTTGIIHILEGSFQWHKYEAGER